MDPRPTAPPRGFPVAEFEDRSARAQGLMAAAGLDALLLTTEPEFRYFSGFLSQFWESPTRPWFLIVPAAGKPIAVVPEIGAQGLAATWLDDVRCWPAPRPEDDGVGLPMGAETHLRMPLTDFARLRGGLPATEFVDATALIRSLRLSKSEREIDKIRHVCQIAAAAFANLPAQARTGKSERDICRAMTIDLLAGGADAVPYLIAGSGPGGYDSIIMGPTDRILETGDVLIIDTGATYDGYFCDFDRNFAFAAAAADVWRAMGRVLEAGGALGNTVGRSGHGLGMQLTEPLSLMASDATVLMPGMVITPEPGMIFAPGKMMVHEENIIIRDGAPELLSPRAPAEMPVIG